MKSIFPYLVFIFLLVQFVRAILAAQKQGSAHQDGHDETEEQKRMREVQERIRRKIAERRGGAAAPAEPPPVIGEAEPPRARPTMMAPSPVAPGPLETAIPEVFRKVLAPEPAPVVRAPEPAADTAAVLARQEQLADQLRELEAARAAAQKRAALIAAEQAAASPVEAARRARAGWVGELRDAKNLKRAVVLREVLGTPVGLR
ncbi:MAG: hypothetical protein HZA93_27755 [Verrucomicrobia bacterium]|nr:hypothetical protein [Verrucomicrobiota bacterium]